MRSKRWTAGPKYLHIESGPTTDGYLVYTEPVCGDMAVTRERRLRRFDERRVPLRRHLS